MADDNVDLNFSAAQTGRALNGRRDAVAIEELSDSELELWARSEAPAEAKVFNGEYTKALGAALGAWQGASAQLPSLR